MNRLHKIFFTLLALASLICWAPANARAASDGVVDDAHIFSPDAISRADQIARQIEDMHKRQVLVQTFSAVPDDLQSKLQADGKERFFSEWSHQLGREKHLTGILILICMNPAHIEVTVGNATQQVFPDRDPLTQLLLSNFKAKQYDRGLVDGMQYIADHMTRPRANNGTSAAGGNNQGAGTPAPPPVSGPSNTSTHGFSFHLGGCVCAAIALVIILMLVASLTRRRGGYTGGYGPGPGYGGAGYPPGAYPPGGYPQSGGGFGRSLLGGLLGGALGSWGYDRMRGNQGGQMGVPPPMGGGNPPDANLPPDTSYSSSGGDFGSSPDPGGSSGGDFGGSSGGDFGGSSGGDFGGGGGGDMGGGGGDAGGSSGGDF